MSLIGQTVQFTALGTTSDPRSPQENLTSAVTWTSSTPSVATIDSAGLATATGCGSSLITAQSNSIVGSTSLTVNCNVTTGNPVLQSISLSPSSPSIPQIGQTTQFIALGNYVPATTNNVLTSIATWASSNAAVATINSAGLATAASCGTTTITVTYQGFLAQTQLTVACTVAQNPTLQSITLYPGNPSIPQVGQTTQFIALGAYVPASTNNDLTSAAAWASSNAAVATVNSTGLATAVSCGTTTITAEYQGVVGQTQLTVSCTVAQNPVLQSITLYPSNPTIPQIGQTTQFIAQAVYSPAGSNNVLTDVATWASSNSTIATVNSGGLATAAACGVTTITAEYQGVVGQMLLTVLCAGNQTLQSISVVPSAPSIPQIGQTTQFTALGTLIQGGQVDVTQTATWASSNPAVATVSSTGAAISLSCGTTTITAESQNLVGVAVLTVSCTSITSIELIVVKTGSTPATISSSPTGIDCGTTCAALFNEGTGITLTASPAPTSWTGCDQVIAANLCSLTLLPDVAGGTSKQVTANY